MSQDNLEAKPLRDVRRDERKMARQFDEVVDHESPDKNVVKVDRRLYKAIKESL